MTLSLKDFQRFEKQIILKQVGIAGQKKIQQAKVLIIGMGGIGCPLLTYLASAGICNIGIVDHDKVEIGNLSRQILFNSTDLGKYKVVQAKSKIRKLYKKIKINYFKTKNINVNQIDSILIENIKECVSSGEGAKVYRYMSIVYCKDLEGNKRVIKVFFRK